MSERIRAITGIFLVVLIVSFCLSPQFRSIYNLPPNLRVIEGEATLFTVNFPLTMDVNQESEESIRLNSKLPSYLPSRPVSLEPIRLGKAILEFKLLGLIPIRTVQVDVLPPLRLVPGGHSIGVVLHSQGVIVVGHSPVQSRNGQYHTPAKDAGINVGDVILSVNGLSVQSDSQLAEVIDGCGHSNEPINLLIKRGQEKLLTTVASVICEDTKRYRIGLFVRDSAAGVGTLTFFENNSKTYGALGHVITDSDTNQPIDCEQGKIVLATVSGIQHGKRGQPGEKIGVFIDEDQVIGDIRKNTPFGIYGKMKGNIDNNLYSQTLPVGSMSQIQQGSAEILTVVDGQTIERFQIEIQRINLQEYPEGKGLVLKVTDQKLINKTGGIVQGMSGSPIIQNGRIIGAVTHVFVHDPTKGYGCFIDWMLMESGIIPQKDRKTVKRLFSRIDGFFYPVI